MNVLIADKFEPSGIEQLKSAGISVQYTPGLSGDELAGALRQTRSDVLVVRSTKVPAPVIEKAAELRLIVRAGSGTDTIDVSAATRRGIRVCNCPGQNSVAVAELTLGLMVALDRRIVDETDDLRRRVWNKKEYSKARGLKGRTLGIIGLGRIGVEVAKRAHAFEMRLIYTDTIPRPNAELQYGIHPLPLGELLRQSDFVTLHVPGGAGTRHLIGVNELATMKHTAYIINCSRGGVIDETALAAAVSAGRLAGAALDVWETEPAAGEAEFTDPVVNAPHIYGTHHVGASTEQAQMEIAHETVRIVKAYYQNGEYPNCVNA